MIAAAAAALAGLHHDDDRKGGRGKCRHCGQYENNVSYHEAWECSKRVIAAPDWLVERMDKVSKMPPPTLAEVETQMSASAAQRKLLDDILEDVPVITQQEAVELIFKSKPLPFEVNMEKCKWRKH